MKLFQLKKRIPEWKQRLPAGCRELAHWLRKPFIRFPDVFNHSYIELEPYYFYRFKKMPQRLEIFRIQSGPLMEFFLGQYGELVKNEFQSCLYNNETRGLECATTVFVLKHELMIGLHDDDVTILFQPGALQFVSGLAEEFKVFRVKEKEQHFEINIVRITKTGLLLKALRIDPVELDLSLYYNDDFPEVDQVIQQRLQQENDKGLVLLHGAPGTGKTTYLRYLVGRLKKRALFIPASAAGDLMSPDFMDLLIENPNSVLVIEDAEHVIMDRKMSPGSSVSTILNLSDGLLSDCVNLQIICTFNSPLALIDPALMRQGRMIARYEFGALTREKSERLSRHLGFQQPVTRSMTLAEISGQTNKNFEQKHTEVIGFRHHPVKLN